MALIIDVHHLPVMIKTPTGPVQPKTSILWTHGQPGVKTAPQALQEIHRQIRKSAYEFLEKMTGKKQETLEAIFQEMAEMEILIPGQDGPEQFMEGLILGLSVKDAENN